MDVVRRADWVVDIGPDAGEGGGRVLYSGPVAGLEQVGESATSQYLLGRAQPVDHRPRTPHGWLHLRGVSRHNLRDLSVDVPLCVLTAVTGVFGSGKSTLVTQVLAEFVRGHLGLVPEEPDGAQLEVDVQDVSGVEPFDRLVLVDQTLAGREESQVPPGDLQHGMSAGRSTDIEESAFCPGRRVGAAVPARGLWPTWVLG